MAGVPDGSCVQIGFRPYTVKLSNDLSCYQLRGVVKHVYFLGVAYRVEIQSEDGAVLRSRLNKEEYRERRYQAGQKVSFAIAQFRVLPTELGGCTAPMKAMDCKPLLSSG